MRHFRWLMALALLATAGAAPLRAQIHDWQYQWFWGAKAGVTSMELPSSKRTSSIAPDVRPVQSLPDSLTTIDSISV